MRIALSGAHATGKSTLAAELVRGPVRARAGRGALLPTRSGGARDRCSADYLAYMLAGCAQNLAALARWFPEVRRCSRCRAACTSASSMCSPALRPSRRRAVVAVRPNASMKLTRRAHPLEPCHSPYLPYIACDHGASPSSWERSPSRCRASTHLGSGLADRSHSPCTMPSVSDGLRAEMPEPALRAGGPSPLCSAGLLPRGSSWWLSRAAKRALFARRA